jgi:ATP-dependent RNA helicase SUPV3L1/SUV3
MTSHRASQRALSGKSPVTAVLGPTNTGKTHYAVERMLGHGGGMIGLPLRLLAREIYERVRARAGDHAVALITGEEKIIPAQPRYWVCTVEAMPPDIDVPFLAIDEVQLANDLERGHIFTDRILHRRGSAETLLLGAGTMRGILERMLPRTTFISRPRLSKLTYAGQRKLTRLPRRSAIVAFTAEMVYTVAELIRRQQGGAAVVMGALSPRTRNAQVALYQSGEVDYIVATDAIGMGLNMDVDHVAFAATRKFDGFQFRNLTPGELGQVAGRAGRHLNDGTFGVSGEAEPFEQETVERLENHNFDSVRVLQWRNRDLDFRSLDTLRKSLGDMPRLEGLTRAQNAPDVDALEAVSRDESVHRLVASPVDVQRAWDACQIPDYRNISPGEHAHLVGKVIGYLQTGKGHIPEDWFSQQLSYCENLEGGIDALSTRISHVRTWTFIANRANWLEAPYYWQGRAKEIEDRLSDVLHERLTHRFIDRKTSVLMRRLAKKEDLMSSVEDDGVISVEGEAVGKISGLSFVPDPSIAGHETRVLKAAAVQALAAEIAARAKSLSSTADTELKLSRLGNIEWQGHAVGRLSLADARYKPRADVISDDVLNPADRDMVRERLQKFADRHLGSLLEPLLKLEESDGLEGTVRGVAYRLAENFGVLPREDVAEEVKQLSQEERAKLRGHGVRFGAFNLFLPALLKPAATEARLLLWWLEKQKAGTAEGDVPAAPANGLTSAPADATKPDGFYRMCGYRVCGPRAVRVDMVERLSDLIRDRVFWKPRIPEEARPAGSVEGGGFVVIPDMMSLVGCSGEEFEAILASLGFRYQPRLLPKVATPGAKGKAEPAVAEAAVEAVSVEAAVESVSVEEVATATADMPLPVAETLQQDDGVDEVPADVAPADVAIAGPVGADVPTPAEDLVETKVWWPDGMGPFRVQRHRPDRRQARRPGGTAEHKPDAGEKPERAARPDNGKRHHGKPHGEKARGEKARGEKAWGDRKDNRAEHRGERTERPRFDKPKRVERVADPNSPFAVLGALKAQLEKGDT